MVAPDTKPSQAIVIWACSESENTRISGALAGVSSFIIGDE